MVSERLKWNSPATTSENFDDEVVIVNFDSGKYHSLQGTGRLIWQWLEPSASVTEIVQHSIAYFSGENDVIEREVREFIDTLRDEGLLVAASSETVSATSPAEGAPDSIPFTRPVLNTFSDMQELLWLDPIHEVDEAGWPVTKENSGTDA